jgi:SAM-dependent methyltransferase
MLGTGILHSFHTNGGAPPSGLTPEQAQARASEAAWSSGEHVATYANRELRPAEVMLLVRYRDALGGRVLEVGCGAGRVTGYLVALGGEVHGLDVSSTMVEHCAATYPAGTFSQGDMRDLSALEPGSFDVVVAAYAVLDVVNDAERRQALGEIHRVLAPDGLLIMSSHNRAFKITGPVGTGRGLIGTALDLRRAPRRLHNRRSLRRYEVQRPDYAILNDSAHDYSVLHYYITRDVEQRQLAELGFELIECTDLDGRPVASGESAPEHPELHYVARRR